MLIEKLSFMVKVRVKVNLLTCIVVSVFGVGWYVLFVDIFDSS